MLLAFLFACNNDDDKTETNELLPLSEVFTQQKTSTSKQLTDISFADENNGIICGASGELLKTVDGGQNWRQVASPSDMSFSSVFMYDVKNIFLARRGFYKTTTGGDFQEVGGMSEYNGAIMGIYFTSPSVGFMLKESVVAKTTDGGNTWVPLFNENPYVKQLQFVSSKVAYVFGGTTRDGASGGVLYATTDGGNTWKNMNLQTSEIMAAHFIDDKRGFITDFERYVSETKDGGKTWVRVGRLPEPRFPGNASSILYANDKQLFVTNFAGQLLKSENNGADWRVIYETENEYALMKIYRNKQNLYMIGDDGLVLKNYKPEE